MAGHQAPLLMYVRMPRAMTSAAVWLLATSASLGAAAAAADKQPASWTEGQHFFLITPALPTSVPRGKIEVTEVFSYGCPACNHFVPVMRKLRQSLPANTVVNFMPAGFN